MTDGSWIRLQWTRCRFAGVRGRLGGVADAGVFVVSGAATIAFAVAIMRSYGDDAVRAVLGLVDGMRDDEHRHA